MNSRVYHTTQQQAVMDFLRRNRDRQYSIAQIAQEVCKDGVGKSTLYRRIAQLAQEGSVRRFRGEDGRSVVYQYVGEDHACDHHFHLKCAGCGVLIHLECEQMHELKEHIRAHHQFSIDPASTVLYGLCADCCTREQV